MTKGATPFVDLNGVLHQLVSELHGALGDKLVGVYLQGSFAIGDFDEHSDVDFIVAITAPLTPAEVDRLQEMHGRIYDLECPWAQHLEGSYFPLDVLRVPDVGRPLWYLNHGARSLIESNHCNTRVVRWTVRERGVTLFGPPPVSLVDEVAVEELRAEIRTVMKDWGAEILGEPDRYRNHFYQAFIVLSYCRMLHDQRTGTISSKKTGAEWMQARSPEWADLIERAWTGRPDPAASVRRPADPKDFALTFEFLQEVLTEVR